MSTFLFGDCGCCRSSILAGGDWMAIDAVAPYNFGWALIDDGNGSQIVVPNPLGTVFATQVPAVIYRTRTFGGTTSSYSIWGKLTSGPAGGLPDGLSDPYSYQDAVKTAIGLMTLVGYGGSFPVYDYYGVRTDYKLRYAAESLAGENNTQHCSVSADQDGNPIFQVGGGGHYQAANGYMIGYIGDAGAVMDGLVIVGQSMLRTPTPIHSKSKHWFDFLPAQAAGYHDQVMPYEQPPGEYVFAPGDAPERGFMSVSGDAAPGLGH